MRETRRVRMKRREKEGERDILAFFLYLRSYSRVSLHNHLEHEFSFLWKKSSFQKQNAEIILLRYSRNVQRAIISDTKMIAWEMMSVRIPRIWSSEIVLGNAKMCVHIYMRTRMYVQVGNQTCRNPRSQWSSSRSDIFMRLCLLTRTIKRERNKRIRKEERERERERERKSLSDNKKNKGRGWLFLETLSV